MLADNFEVKHQGGTASQPRYYIQRYNNPLLQKLQAPDKSSDCFQTNITTDSTETTWFAEQGENGNSESGIKLYTVTGNGTEEIRWYLRVDAFDASVSLVCDNDLVSMRALKIIYIY